ncbi:MAG: hypothetical protein JKX72_00215 [Robiginitomaculum sp.]|nr:hypothetical protein [Robiginitomaculum sp.]
METLLEQAIKKIIELASKHKKELLKVQHTLRWMEPTGKGRSEGRSDTIEVPYFKALYDDLKTELEVSKEVSEFRVFIESFVKKKGKFLPFFSSEQNAQRQVEIIFGSYFYKAQSLRLDKGIIQKTCEQFVEEICSDETTLVAILQIKDFDATSSFDLEEGITFRPITMTDIQECCIRRRFEIPTPSNILNLNDWVCEIRKPINKANAGSQPDVAKELTSNNFHDLPELIAEALNLTFSGRAAINMMYETIESPYISFGTSMGGNEIYTCRHGEQTRINKRQINKLKEIYTVLKTYRGTKGYKDLNLALRRLRAAAGRQNFEDHIVDCVIGMEYLLAPDGREGETTYKCKIRGASLLSDKFGDVEARKKFMGDLYSKRSAIVHGCKGASKDIVELSEKAEEALREIFVWYLTTGLSIGNRQEIATKLDATFIKGAKKIRGS